MPLGALLARLKTDPRFLTELRYSGPGSILEGSAPGTVIGSLAVYVGGVLSGDTWTFSIDSTAGGRIAVSGSNVVAGAVATDFDTSQVAAVILRATNPVSGQFVLLSTTILVLEQSITITGINFTWQPGFEAGACLDNVGSSPASPVPVALLEGDPADADYQWALPDNGGGRLQITPLGDGTAMLECIGSLLGLTSLDFRVRCEITGVGTFAEDGSLAITHVNQAPTEIAVAWAFAGAAVPESTAIGTVLIAAADIDVTDEVGDTHTISIVQDQDLKVTKNGSGDIVLAGTLHATTKAQHNFTLRAEDQDGEVFDKVISFTVSPAAADSEATDLIARADVAPTTARAANVRRLMARIKRAGWLPHLDFLFIPAAATQPFANENWMGEFGALSPQASCPWAADAGYTGNGSGYVNLGINPNAGTPSPAKMLIADIFGMVLCTTDSVNVGKDLGSGNGRLRLVAKSAGNITGAAGQNTVSTQANVGGLPPSMLMVTQKAGLQQLWRNASGIPADIDTVTPALLPTALTLLQTGGAEFSDRTVGACAGGTVPTTFLAERIRAFYEALTEYLTALPLEVDEEEPEPLPDIDMTAASPTGFTYVRAGSMPYLNASRVWGLAGANVLPLDHHPATGAVLGRRLIPFTSLVNAGPGRVWTGWTTSGGASIAADTGYTTMFGDTLGGVLSEGSGGSAVARFVNRLVTTLLPNRGVTFAVIARPVSMTDRLLRLQAIGNQGTHGFYTDFDLTGAGAVVRRGVFGNGRTIAGQIFALPNGDYFCISYGMCTGSNATSAGTQVRIQAQLVTAAGVAAIVGAGQSCRIDNVTATAHCNIPPLFGTLSSISAPSVFKVTAPDATYDVGLTNDAGTDFFSLDKAGAADAGPSVDWPLEARQVFPGYNSNANVGDFFFASYTEQWISRLRLLPQGDADPLILPQMWAQCGRIFEAVNVPNVAPFTVTLAQAPGAIETVTVDGLTRVVGAPVSGQFSVSGAVVTFHTSDGGRTKRVRYWNADGYMAPITSQITGGGAAAWTDLNGNQSGAGSFKDAAWNRKSSTAARFRFPASVSGTIACAANPKMYGVQNMTIRGHGRVFWPRGSMLWVGDLGGGGAPPQNIMLEDGMIWPGRHPIAKPGSYQDPYTASVPLQVTVTFGAFVLGERVQQSNGAFGTIEAITNVSGNEATLWVYGRKPSGGAKLNFFQTAGTPPVIAVLEQRANQSATGAITARANLNTFTPGTTPFGAVQPAEGWGADFGNREAISVTEGVKIGGRHLILCGGIDECFSWNMAGNSSGMEIGLTEHCIIAETLRYPKDLQGRGLHNEEQAHGEAQLIGSTVSTPTKKCRNATARYNLYYSNIARNPLMHGVLGGHAYNNVVRTWSLYGSGLQFEDKHILHPTAAYEGNYYISNPNGTTGGAGIGGTRAAIRLFSGSDVKGGPDGLAAYYLKDNYYGRPDNHAADVLVHLNIDPDVGHLMMEHRGRPKYLTRERPFYSAELAEDPTRYKAMDTPTNRAASLAWVKARAGLRPRDGSDNIIPGSYTGCWQTERMVEKMFNLAVEPGFIDDMDEVGGYAIDKP